MSVPALLNLGVGHNIISQRYFRTLADATDTLSSTETGFIDGVTAGTALASKALVLNSSKEVAGVGRMTLGTRPTQTDVGQVDGCTLSLYHATNTIMYGLEVNTDMDSNASWGTKSRYVAAIKGSFVFGTAPGGNNTSVIGVLGMLNTNTVGMEGGDKYGVRGHLDFWGSSTLTGGNVNVGALSAYVEHEATTTVAAGSVLCGLCAYQVGSPTLGSGTYPTGGLNPAVWIRANAAASAWQTGIYMPVNSVETGIRIGNWVGSGALLSAIPFATVQNVYSDGQLDLVAVFGESSSDLTSAYSAKCGRFRHLVANATGSYDINHETYGLVGQLVCRSVELKHMHAGIMGTLEGNTTATTANSPYTYGVAAIIARVGGGALLEATTCISGFSAVLNGAAVNSGTSSAFSSCGTAAGDWDYGVSLKDCTRAFNFVGACVSGKGPGTVSSAMQILVHVDGQPYSMAVYAVGSS